MCGRSSRRMATFSGTRRLGGGGGAMATAAALAPPLPALKLLLAVNRVTQLPLFSDSTAPVTAPACCRVLNEDPTDVGCLASLCLHVSDIDKATGKQGAGSRGKVRGRPLRQLPHLLRMLQLCHHQSLLAAQCRHHLMCCRPAALLIVLQPSGLTRWACWRLTGETILRYCHAVSVRAVWWGRQHAWRHQWR
jgi:hypothetical protein